MTGLKGYVITQSRFRNDWRVTNESKVLDVVSMPSVWILSASGWAKL